MIIIGMDIPSYVGVGGEDEGWGSGEKMLVYFFQTLSTIPLFVSSFIEVEIDIVSVHMHS